MRLKLITESSENLARYGRLLIGGVERRLNSVREASGGAIARFEGIADRSAAEALRSSLVEVERAQLPPLEDGEYYLSDLIGLPCFDPSGAEVGRVAGVDIYGAGDLLEIETTDGRRSLIPFRPGIADLEDGRITLDPEFLA